MSYLTNKMMAVAAIFYERYVAARQDAEYVRQKKEHQERHEGQGRRTAGPRPARKAKRA
jgi:hypothetical protein